MSGDVGGPTGGRGAAVAEQVDGDQPVPVGQVRSDSGPVEVAAAQPVDADQQRRIVGAAVVGHVHGAVDVDLAPGGRHEGQGGHPVEATGRGGRSGRAGDGSDARQSGRQEVDQERVDQLGRLELHPVAGSLEPSVPPWAGHVGTRPGHLLLGQGETTAAPHAHGRCLHVRQAERRSHPPSGVMLARCQLRAADSEPVASHRAMTASASGWWHQARKLARSSADSHCSATSGNWKKNTYREQGQLLDHDGPEALGLSHRQHHDVVHPLRHERGERPGQGRPEVVTDDMGPIDAQVVEDGDHVADRVQHRWSSTARGTPESPNPRRSGTMHRNPASASAGTWCRQSAPESGKPWRKWTGRPSPRHLDMDPHSTAVDVLPLATPARARGQRLSPDGKCRAIRPVSTGPRLSGHRVVIDFSRVLNRTPSIPWMCASPKSDCFHPPNE